MNIDLSDPLVLSALGFGFFILIVLPRVLPMFWGFAKRWYEKGKSVQADRSKIEEVEKTLNKHLEACSKSSAKSSKRLESLEHQMIEVTTLLKARDKSAQTQHEQLMELLKSFNQPTEQ